MKKSIFGLALVFSLTPILELMALPSEPLGPASRRTGLVISEILYGIRSCEWDQEEDDDGPGQDWYTHEFIEIYNSNPYFEDLSGLRLTGNISHQFPPGTTLAGGGFLVLRHGQYSGALSGCKGVQLRDKSGAVLLEVTYTNTPPWPVAERTEHSIVLQRPSYGQNNPKAWGLSDQKGGSPGEHEPMVVRASDVVRINELYSAEGRYFVELYNHSQQAIDLSGYILSSDAYSRSIQEGTTLPPRGFLAFETGPNRFTTILRTPDRNHIVDAVLYEGAQPFGRYPDGGEQLYLLFGTSTGEPNSAPFRSEVVINEIMYAPIGADVDDEYIELYNRGPNAVDVSGWSVGGGIAYTIGSGTIIAPSNYLVVAKNPARLIGRYPHLDTGNVVGGFLDDLDDDGERLVLIDNTGRLLDDLTYGAGGQWGTWSRGGGSSLELKDARSDGRYAHNWADSDESNKGVWTTIQGIAKIGETLGGTINDQLHIFLLGMGDCLVDEVEVRANRGSDPNVVANGGFESALEGWTAQGSHDHSLIWPQGYSGNSSLRLMAATAGDNGANRVRNAAFTSLVSGDVLLRARVKWLRGSPEIALRLRGGGVDVSGRMQIQPNGTPGLRNSRALDNAGPAIADVGHAPLLPEAGEAVRVTATVVDPDAPVGVALRFQVDPSAVYVTVPMLDNGAAGDEVADDGVYTATLPGQPPGTRIGFYILANDVLDVVNTFPQDIFPTPPHDRVFPTDAYNRECVVRWGETNLPGRLGTYHLWLNSANTLRWANRRPVMNNTPLDATFVYNNSRVIYNVRPAYHSSEWHRNQRTTGPDGAQRIDYSVQFPADAPFLGAQEALWINPGNPGGPETTDDSGQVEPAANTILRAFGLQNNYQRFIHVFVNGSRRSMDGTRPFIMQDAQRPNADMADQWSDGNCTGDLLWVEDWFEFMDDGDTFIAYNDADLTRREVSQYAANGAETKAFHLGAYRFMFRPAELRPGEGADDYSTLSALLNVVSPASDPAGPVRLGAVEPILDYRQWMRMLAAQHTLGNWDTYGYDRGRNAYIYRGSAGPAQLWAWKNNFTLGIGGHGPTMDLFNTTDPRIQQMWREPTILRAYWEAFHELINGPFHSAYMDPILDARVAALQANGVAVSGAALATIKGYIRARRDYLAARLGGTINTPLTVTTVSTNGNVLTLQGTAPIRAHIITVNGAAYPVTWLTVPNNVAPPTNWTAKVVLAPGLNNITVAVYSTRWELVAGPITVHATYDGPVAEARDSVIISEIMYCALQPKAEYVELFNKSANYSFDLFNWKLDGVDFDFPAGAILQPNQFLVVARNAFSLGAAFPVPGPIYTYAGELDRQGEVLSLLLPYQQGVVDRVRYEAQAPWPAGAACQGSALQVVDVEEDNSRVSNWTDGLGWRYVSFTGTISGSAIQSSRGTNFYIFLKQAGTLYLDDLVLVRGTVPEIGPNVLQNAGFEEPFGDTWTALGNHSDSHRSTETRRTGAASLKVVSTGTGSAGNVVRQFIPGSTSNEVFTLSFWFLPDDTGALLTARTAPGSLFTLETGIAPVVATPGQSNSFPVDLPPYDPIWLNEVASTDGHRWLEIYNAGTAAASLDGYSIALEYSSSAAAPFAPDDVVDPGEFKVFPLVTIRGLPPTQIALTRLVRSVPQIVDYFNITAPVFGALPDGQPFTRGPLRYETPGLSNLSPRIKSITPLEAYIYLRFDVIPGFSYRLEYKNDLSEPSWNLLDSYVADEFEFTYADNPPGNQRFYRLTLTQ